MNIIKSTWNSTALKIDSMTGTDLQKKVKEATSNENWGTSSTLKNEIADETSNYQSFREIFEVLWKRVGEKESNWRVVFKSLDLINHILKFGHDRCIDEVRDHSIVIRPLQSFRYYDPDTGTDRGRGVREISKQILDLVNDRDHLNEVREEAQKQRGKLSHISGTGKNYSGFGSNRSNYSSYSSNNYKSSSYKDTTTSTGSKKKKTIKKKKSKRKKPKKKEESEEEEEEESESSESSEKPKPKKKKKKQEKLKKNHLQIMKLQMMIKIHYKVYNLNHHQTIIILQIIWIFLIIMTMYFNNKIKINKMIFLIIIHLVQIQM